ncbi:MAG: hypothetical protein U1E25_12120, partial [Methylocystis sp.]
MLPPNAELVELYAIEEVVHVVEASAEFPAVLVKQPFEMIAGSPKAWQVDALASARFRLSSDWGRPL